MSAFGVSSYSSRPAQYRKALAIPIARNAAMSAFLVRRSCKGVFLLRNGLRVFHETPNKPAGANRGWPSLFIRYGFLFHKVSSPRWLIRHR